MPESFPDSEVKAAARAIVDSEPLPTPVQPMAEQTSWDNVAELLTKFQLTEDIESRSIAISGWKAEDLIAASAALHSVVAPGVDTAPAEKAIKITSPAGELVKELASPEERQAIFEKAIALIKQLYEASTPDTRQAFLDRVSNIVGLSVVLAHVFEDGNGRTARVLAHSIRSGYDGSDQIKKDIETLGTNRPNEGFRVNSYLPRGDAKDIPPDRVLDMAARLDIPLQETDLYKKQSWDTFTSPYA